LLFFLIYFYFNADIALLQPVFFNHSNDKITNVHREESVLLNKMILRQVCLWLCFPLHYHTIGAPYCLFHSFTADTIQYNHTRFEHH